MSNHSYLPIHVIESINEISDSKILNGIFILYSMNDSFYFHWHQINSIQNKILSVFEENIEFNKNSWNFGETFNGNVQEIQSIYFENNEQISIIFKKRNCNEFRKFLYNNKEFNYIGEFVEILIKYGIAVDRKSVV